MSAGFDYEHLTPENMRRAARTAAEAIRYLNHGTFSDGCGALEYPSDLDRILADLETLGERLPQLLGQLSAWLVNEYKAGRVRVDSAPAAHSPSIEAQAVAMVRQYLTEASGMTRTCAGALHDARQITAKLAGVPSEGENEEGED